MVAGASGGPKWFVLYGLDRYLFGSFFRGRQRPLHTIGSSAGAWRLACLGLDDPLAAIDRLASLYSTQTYSSSRPDRHEVSEEARRLLHRVLGDDGPRQIADNAVVRVNIIADRARGLLGSERQAPLSVGLAACALANAFSRRTLGWFFERTVFHSRHGRDELMSFDDLPTRRVALTADNVPRALMASGSIPLIMEGVSGIPGARRGVYRDGGITDYHLDLRYDELDGLVLYPHFYAGLTPGWFDKLLRWRCVDPSHFDNVVLVTPSAQFVASLPYGKIPDRKDFEVLDEQRRIDYWTAVLAASRQLGEDFINLVEHGRGIGEVRPLIGDRNRHL